MSLSIISASAVPIICKQFKTENGALAQLTNDANERISHFVNNRPFNEQNTEQIEAIQMLKSWQNRESLMKSAFFETNDEESEQKKIAKIIKTKKCIKIHKRPHSAKGPKQKLECRLKQIKSSESEMNAFKQRLLQIKQRQKQIKINEIGKSEKIRQNAKKCGDLQWSSRRQMDENSHWNAQNDETLLDLMERFKEVSSDKKWNLISMIMAKNARDCNQRAAVLMRQKYTKREHLLCETAKCKKQSIENEKQRECELKFERMRFAESQRKIRKIALKRQRHLAPLQKKWLLIMSVVDRLQTASNHLTKERELEQQNRLKVRACVCIQTFVRKRMRREREWNAYLSANSLRSMLRLCVLNRKINKYNRSAAIIESFLQSQSNSHFNPISFVISNFRNSVLTIQRFARNNILNKKSVRIIILKRQLDEYIASLPSKKGRYRFTENENAINQSINEFYQQKMKEHRRRIKIYLRQIKRLQRKSRTSKMVQMMTKNKKIINFKMQKIMKPQFGLKIDCEELDALILKAEKFHKLQQTFK